MSEERVSALEQTLRDRSQRFSQLSNLLMGKGYQHEEQVHKSDTYKDAADLVHDRDAELFALVAEWRQIARNTVDPSCAASYHACAANLVYRLTEKADAEQEKSNS